MGVSTLVVQVLTELFFFWHCTVLLLCRLPGPGASFRAFGRGSYSVLCVFGGGAPDVNLIQSAAELEGAGSGPLRSRGTRPHWISLALWSLWLLSVGDPGRSWSLLC